MEETACNLSSHAAYAKHAKLKKKKPFCKKPEQIMQSQKHTNFKAHAKKERKKAAKLDIKEALQAVLRTHF